jgi:hypothetical protein
MILRLLTLAFLILTCPACTPGVTRQQVLDTAISYKNMRWMPEKRHVRHGKDGHGRWVHTPDVSLARHTGDPKGWWRPDVGAVGMPYMWGGFDTPGSFNRKLRRGYFAGDIATEDKKRRLEAAVSRRAAGIDCSGFVSRCWRLRRAHSTRTLHLVSHRLDSWQELLPGDILLNNGHVMIFLRRIRPGGEISVIEAGPHPLWKVSEAEYRIDYLLAEGYAPWRYNRIRE